MIDTKKHMAEMRDRSGTIRIKSHLVSFLYQLMRDHVPTATVEEIMLDSSDPDVIYTNGWLALYAEDIAKRLGDSPERLLNDQEISYEYG